MRTNYLLFLFVVLFVACQNNNKTNQPNNGYDDPIIENSNNSSNSTDNTTALSVNTAGPSTITPQSNSTPPFTCSKTTHRFIDGYGGKLFEVSAYFRNNSNKVISTISAQIYFKDKNTVDPSDYTGAMESRSCEENVVIFNRAEEQIKFVVTPPDNLNMVYAGTKIQRIIYDDGSYVDL
jgi:hypothetical protein